MHPCVRSTSTKCGVAPASVVVEIEPLAETVRRLGGDPALCCLIGDSDTDRNTAKALGVPSVLVTFGPSGEDMAALEPEALLERFEDLPDLVETLYGSR